jgi:UDP-MurNAc hydroxylase
VFKPKVTIPFASFVYFSHKENRYMNNWINTPDEICEKLKDSSTQLQFLCNGDSWSSDHGFLLHGDPLEKYRRCFLEIPLLTYRSHPSFSEDEIIALGRALAEEVRQSFPQFVLGRVPPIRFYVTDLATAVLFDLARGRVESTEELESDCDIALSSQALWFAFKFPWGFGTLEVSGRYRQINPHISKRALYLCHLWASDLHLRNLSSLLMQRRVWSFCWSKRFELMERLLRRTSQQ